jgi:antitoxin ChpS
MGYETKLRKVGGSVMLSIPPVLLDELGLAAGADMELTVRSRKLVLEPKSRRRHALDELLKEEKSRGRRRRKDRVWTSGGRAGRELI